VNHLAHDLFVDEYLQLLLSEIVFVFVEVKEFFGNRVSSWLIIRVMVRLEVRMLQSIFNSDALDGVEGKETLEQVQGQVRGAREHDLPRDLLLEWKRADVLASTARLDAIVVFHRWCSKDVKNEGELVVIILAWEKRLPTQHLGKNAANTPNINGLGILLKREHNLRCAVPARSNVLSHEARVVFC